MPTENRSSNTESKIRPLAQHPEGRRERFQKWVLATKHPVLGYLDGTWLARGDDREGYADKYVQGLWVAYKEFGQPAPQPHPAPIAWMVGTAFWWTKEEAERDAAETGLPIVGLGPMTGHGEVERCEARLHEVASLCASVEQERDALRIQLAERDALPQFAQTVIRKLKRFRDCAEDGQGADIGKTWFDVLVQLGLLNRVQRSPAWWEITDEGEALLDGRVALSASAEPSAPVDATHYYPEAEPGRHWRKKVGGLWCESCGGKWLPLDVQDMSHGYVAIEPSAPVEIDERKEFEKAVIDKAERFHPELRQYGDQPDAEYRDANIEWAWGLWQARAALERKPQVKS